MIRISGAVWAIYHYPLILFSEYSSGAPKAYVLIVFTWMAVASSYIYAWFRLKSGSVWTAVITPAVAHRTLITRSQPSGGAPTCRRHVAA